jgi:hypothetical protein
VAASDLSAVLRYPLGGDRAESTGFTRIGGRRLHRLALTNWRAATCCCVGCLRREQVQRLLSLEDSGLDVLTVEALSWLRKKTWPEPRKVFVKRAFGRS